MECLEKFYDKWVLNLFLQKERGLHRETEGTDTSGGGLHESKYAEAAMGPADWWAVKKYWNRSVKHDKEGLQERSKSVKFVPMNRPWPFQVSEQTWNKCCLGKAGTGTQAFSLGIDVSSGNVRGGSQGGGVPHVCVSSMRGRCSGPIDRPCLEVWGEVTVWLTTQRGR